MMRSRRSGYGNRPVSRRGVLIGGVAVLAGAGAGVAAGVVRPLHRHQTGKAAPAELLDALASETALIARLEAKQGRSPALRAVFDTVHADHVAHAAALRAALRDYEPATPATQRPVAKAPTRQEQRTAEAAAATRAAKSAAQLSGAHAALLASISASEASHAEALR